MNKHRNKYWHIQMYKPYGKEDEARVDSKKMLEREEPFIGTGEWNNHQCKNFKTIEKGSIVLVREGNEAIALCQIISDNFTDRELTDEFLHKNFRRVKILAWAKDYKQPSKSKLFTQGTFHSCVHRSSQTAGQYEYINNWLKHIENMESTNKCARLLERKRNIIIQGAPGTGKTYNTASIALKVLGVTDIDLTDHEAVIRRYKELTTGKRIFFTTFHQSLDYEDFVEGLKPEVQKNEKGESVGVTYELKDGIFKQACQAVTMDESKDITKCIDDFLQHKINGFENKRVIPTITGKSSFYAWWEEGNTTIKCRSIHSTITHDETHSPSPLNIEKVKDQALGEGMENNWPRYAEAFIEAVKEEYKIHGNNKVVLIIDEINRGNVAKVFGELITLLEIDKREGSEHPIQVTLPYSKELFSVPKNLYIIGTMNTTDRSTGTIDYALRRRFAFVTLKSDRSVIEKHYTEPTLKSQALALFDNIEKFIEKKQCGDLGIDDLMVGHSYFMSASEEELKDKMEYEVWPLIAEYINDGILNVSSKEKEAAFEAWRNLQSATIEEVNEEEEQEEE
ncbi:McrB family protein [Alloprevotella tannerae]|uniref:McrB family protein n=1 Tax=Alloprevotella tannerae TaxID=76122 RepID=UPI0028ECD00E|nr:AAA family ATPase [Alloprevotella tannerae]